MNAPDNLAEQACVPEFLRKGEPDAEYALWSNGRFVIVKAGVALSLSRDDLHGLRRYFDQFGGDVP